MKRKLIVVDVETGGLDPKKDSILQFAAVIYQDGFLAGEFSTYVREPVIVADEDALKVNGIKLEDLAKAPSPWEAVQRFKVWLQQNELYGPQTLAGHKVGFDVDYLKRLWELAGEDFEKQFGHRPLCTQTAMLLLEQAGRVTLPGGSASLDACAGFFGLQRLYPMHDALEDARLTARLLAKIIEKIK